MTVLHYLLGVCKVGWHENNHCGCYSQGSTIARSNDERTLTALKKPKALASLTDPVADGTQVLGQTLETLCEWICVPPALNTLRLRTRRHSPQTAYLLSSHSMSSGGYMYTDPGSVEINHGLP